MFKQRIVWLAGLILAAAWLESCGAVTIESGAPDEPVVTPARPPRLMRRDGGAAKAEENADAAKRAEDEHG